VSMSARGVIGLRVIWNDPETFSQIKIYLVFFCRI
jgi:hypothetical protein